MRFSIGKCGLLTRSAGCLLAAAMVLVGFQGTGFANDGLTSNAIIHRAGLTIEWFTHTGVGAPGGLTDWHINVNENKSTTYFTIKAGKYREKFSQNTLSPFGVPYGVEGAREYAIVRSDVLKAEFENDGIKDVKIEVQEYTLPETTVYTLTSGAIVQAIDADTGEVKWSTLVGDPALPSIGVGSNNEFVAAVNGSTLYCLDTKNGKLKWSAKCRYAVSSSPTVAVESIYVPLINGTLETFALDEKGLNSYAYISKGRGTSRAVATEKTVAWPTSQGNLNVAAQFGEKRGVAYQLRSNDAIVSPPAYADGMFFVASLDGFLYAVDEERGVVVWQFSTGHAIAQAPVVLGDFVFVINEKREMFKIGTKSGLEAPGWENPRNDVDRFIAAGKENMYLVDRFGNLMVMSQDAGATLSTVRIGGVKSILPNLENDRLYMVSDRGTIQCIREIASPIPHFHSNEFLAVKFDPADPDNKLDASGQPIPEKPDPDDPFALPGNPDTNKPPAADDNPFGSNKQDAIDDANNPFGGGAKKADDSSSKSDDDDPFKTD